LLAEVVTVFNSVPNKMALSKLHAEVMSGELTIVCSGDAEDAESGREFASKASAGDRVKQALQQAQKKSTALSKDGVGFDFIKKVTVGR
jgi:hypothetical protein